MNNVDPQEIAKLKTLLRLASNHIRAWWDCYGQIDTKILPPSGGVYIVEEIDAALGKEKQQT